MNLAIKNWKDFQHFKDRNPPWIKLHKSTLDNKDWHALSGEASKFLTMLWLIASEDENREGKLPDIETISFRTRISEAKINQLLPQLEHFVTGLISDRYQDDISSDTPSDTQRRGETETEKRREEEKPPACPYSEILNLWKNILHDLPQVRDMTTTRKTNLSARWKKYPDIEWWEKLFKQIRESSFLMGNEPPAPGRTKPFILDFDWLIKEANFVKILEGKYHG